MKVSAIVALLVGLAVGFAIGKASSGSGSRTDLPTAVRPPTPNRPRPVDTAVYRVPVEGSPVSGNPEALVTLVEFSDYQCPFCSRGNTTVTQLQKEYGNKLRVVMKEFPLPMHPNARPAALAALAAGSQGKYWEMHEKLFASQTQLDSANLDRFAEGLGLEMGRFKADLANPRAAAIIARDMDLGSGLGVNGTPAFFVNGRRVPGGAAPIETFKSVIDEELAKAEAMVRSGVPAGSVYAKILEKGQGPAGPVVKKVDAPAESPSFGPAAAKVTIVEWSDFQCPFCARAVPGVESLRQSGRKDVRFVWRNLPLPMHPNARIAALAALAAHQQGKFWEMHDRMFANQGALDRASLEKAAQETGLDLNRFRAALDSPDLAARVATDEKAASTAGVSGTPTFFINGRMHVGAMSADQLRTEVDREVAKADKLLATGVKPADLYNRIVADAMAPATATRN